MLKTRQCLLGFKLGDEVRRVHHVRAKDRYELSFAVGIHALLRGRAAIGTPTVARVHRRLARETMHFCARIGRSISYETPVGQLGPSVHADCDAPALTGQSSLW